jgi:hypothetical protein
MKTRFRITVAHQGKDFLFNIQIENKLNLNVILLLGLDK